VAKSQEEIDCEKQFSHALLLASMAFCIIGLCVLTVMTSFILIECSMVLHMVKSQ